MAAGEASLLKFYTRPGLEQLQIKIQIQPLAVAGAASPCGVINTWIQIQMPTQICTTSVMAFPQILEPVQCKIVFNRYLAIGRSNQKILKNKVVLFSNFASGRTLPTQSTGPQHIQLVPKNCFFLLQISRHGSLK